MGLDSKVCGDRFSKILINAKTRSLVRVIDIILSFLALLIFAIPMIIISALIKLEDWGPVFFVQKRVGQNMRHFKIIKFRSMKSDPSRFQGDVSVRELKHLQRDRERFQTTSEGDPRITRVGKMIRASHLDELPQFFNVLKGEMSIVGVRPDTPVQEVDYPPGHWQERHRLAPGITGQDQVASATKDIQERCALERMWINDPSFRRYFGIIGKTFVKACSRTSN